MLEFTIYAIINNETMRHQIGHERTITPEYTERVEQSRHYWEDRTLDQVRAEMPKPEMVMIGDRFVSAVVLEPEVADRNEEIDVVRFSEHQQGYSPMQYILAKTLQQAVAPESRMIMITADACDFTPEETKKISSGNVEPYAVPRMKILEHLDVRRAILTGYSLGGIAVPAVPGVGSNSVEVGHMNIDEAPSKQARDAKGLQKDFLSSGTWSEQRQAMEESGIPAVQELRKARRMAPDYLAFGLKSLRPENKAIVELMTDSIQSELENAIRAYPDATRKIGCIEGSNLFSPNSLDPSYETTHYYGDGFHKHASVNNPYAQSLMLQDGLSRPW